MKESHNIRLSWFYQPLHLGNFLAVVWGSFRRERLICTLCIMKYDLFFFRQTLIAFSQYASKACVPTFTLQFSFYFVHKGHDDMCVWAYAMFLICFSGAGMKIIRKKPCWAFSKFLFCLVLPFDVKRGFVLSICHTDARYIDKNVSKCNNMIVSFSTACFLI